MITVRMVGNRADGSCTCLVLGDRLNVCPLITSLGEGHEWVEELSVLYSGLGLH
jgi:hypothetical protein